MSTDTTVRIGPYLFDVRSLELSRDGQRVHLQPQPARVLAALVARPGDLVTREELRDAIWGGETFVDFDRSLNFCIRQIRTALDDDATEPKYVETLRGRGYRYKVPASEVLPVPAVRRRRPVWMAAVAVFAAAIVGVVAWTATYTRASLGPAVVIEPFTAGTTDARTWTDGLQTQLAAHMAHASLRVVTVPDPRRPAWRVEGRVDRSGEQYRVTVVLRESTEGLVRWSDIFDGPPGDWIEAQNEMARIITAAVRYNIVGPASGPGIPRRVPRRPGPFG